MDLARPVVDRPTAGQALAEHLLRLGVGPRPVRWLTDAEQGTATTWIPAGRAAWRAVWIAAEKATRWSAAWVAPWSLTEKAAWWRAAQSGTWESAGPAAWIANWSAVEIAGLQAARNVVERATKRRRKALGPERDRWVGMWSPILTAYEAGLWGFRVLEQEVLAVPRPALRVVGDRLHCEDGPAVAWPEGARYYFWRGVRVPDKVILRPRELTAREITAEPNVEIRRVMLERCGPARYLEIGARCIHRDSTGELYRAAVPNDEPLVMVRVLNSTPEPDGSRKNYWLRVPPSVRTAREAVAWTFGQPPEAYRPLVET
jgi:hypothetical protein